MNQTTYNKLVSFIWNIPDDLLRDVYVRGKYRNDLLCQAMLSQLNDNTTFYKKFSDDEYFQKFLNQTFVLIIQLNPFTGGYLSLNRNFFVLATK